MRWVLLDIALVLGALAVLGLLLLRLWRRVVSLGREVSRASEAIARATDELAALAPPQSAPPAPSASRRPAPPRRTLDERT